MYFLQLSRWSGRKLRGLAFNTDYTMPCLFLYPLHQDHDRPWARAILRDRWDGTWWEHQSSSNVIGNGVNHSVALVNLSQPQRSISPHKMSEWQYECIVNLDSPHATFTKVHRAGFILLQIQLWGHNCRRKRTFLAKDLDREAKAREEVHMSCNFSTFLLEEMIYCKILHQS